MGLLALANFFYEGTQFGDCQVDAKNKTLQFLASPKIFFGYILILSRKIKIRENLPQTFTRPSHCVLILVPFFYKKAHSIVNMLSVKWSFTE